MTLTSEKDNLIFIDEYLYAEPIEGDIYRYKVVDKGDGYLTLTGFDDLGTMSISDKMFNGCYVHDDLGFLWPETEEWKIKYQDSLSLRVSQGRKLVYYVFSTKSGSVHHRAVVIDDSGICYLTLVPSFPAPRLGESYIRLHMDLELLAMEPRESLLNKVMEARKADSTLV